MAASVSSTYPAVPLTKQALLQTNDAVFAVKPTSLAVSNMARLRTSCSLEISLIAKERAILWRPLLDQPDPESLVKSHVADSAPGLGKCGCRSRC
jgi:hypothetical protein